MKAQTCPVCSGNGLVPNGFYNQTSGGWSTTSIAPEKCRSCDGRGIVFVPEDYINPPYDDITTIDCSSGSISCTYDPNLKCYYNDNYTW